MDMDSDYLNLVTARRHEVHEGRTKGTIPSPLYDA
jgi:hypothetical protein